MSQAALVLLALASATSGPLDWMAGSWCTQGTASRTCEHWGSQAGGMILGTSHTVRDERSTGFEFMRIDWDGDVAQFHAYPGGTFGGLFRQVERSRDRVVFANTAHDYPQRIAYWREGNVLMAEISLIDGSKPRQWRYEARDTEMTRKD